MPGGDGTGPTGMGPMTGRGAGYCAGYNAPGYANPIAGRGFGRGRGGGWGRRNMYYATGQTGWQRAGFGRGGFAQPMAPIAPPAREEQLEALKAQADMMENGLKEIQSRIQELETNNG